MRIYLIRHGESEANVGLSDVIDCNLSELGLQQSAEATSALAKLGVDLILSSPYRRCLQTAEILRSATGAAAELWPAVHEHHHDPFAPGPWPLASTEDLHRDWPNFVIPPDMKRTHWAAVPEDRAHQWQRISSAVRQLLGRLGRQPQARVAVVTHQAPASVFVQAFCQWQNALNVRLHINPCSVTILEMDASGRRHLVRLNWQPAP